MARPESPKFSTTYGQKIVEVKKDRRLGGYRVVVDFRPAMEEMFEHFEHFALFASEAQARRLAEKVRWAEELDLDHWSWAPSQAAPFRFLQAAPWAQVEVSPRPVLH